MTILEWNAWWEDFDHAKRQEEVNRVFEPRKAPPLDEETESTMDKFMREAGDCDAKR